MSQHPDYDFHDDYHLDHDNTSENYSYLDNDEDYHPVCDKHGVRSFGRFYLPVVYALALVLGLAGNGLLAFVYATQKRLRTLTDVYILHLAVADLLLLLTLPAWAADAVNGWELGVVACKLTSALYTANFTCGMLLLACISVDRYRALTPRPHPARTLRRRALLPCLLAWLVAAALGLPDAVVSTVTQQHAGARRTCRPVYPPRMARGAKAGLELLEVLVGFLLPLLVMGFCYGRAGAALWRGAGAGALGGRRWRAFRVLAVVVGVFLLTQLPYNGVKLARALDAIYALVTECETSRALDRAAQLTESLALTHCCLNPLVYASVGDTFRSHILRLAKRCGRAGRHCRHGDGRPIAVEMALKSPEETEEGHSQACSRTHSISDAEEDTSTFTI